VLDRGRASKHEISEREAGATDAAIAVVVIAIASSAITLV
jgi:hypothetical protein